MAYTIMEQIRWWLPLVSGFALVIKAYMSAKANVSEWASRLLDNHLAHIEVATTSTHEETKNTNVLLAKQSDMILDHQSKNLEVWQGVVGTLKVLEDRTRVRKATPKRGKDGR